MTFTLLDLFCKAGGAAKGYADAGFDVTGVDIEPQPRYPFRFVRADALEYLTAHGHEFDAIHASPPCQAFCALKHLTKNEHPNLIPQTRALLKETGRPYVIENVPGAPLLSPVMLCGTMFGLQTDCGAELRRHRLFETNWPLMRGLKCSHYRNRKTISITGKMAEEYPRRTICVNGTGLPTEGRETITVTGPTPQQNVVKNKVRKTFPVSSARVAMGIDWMPMSDLSQAIPPAYTHYIGKQLHRWIEVNQADGECRARYRQVQDHSMETSQ